MAAEKYHWRLLQQADEFLEEETGRSCSVAEFAARLSAPAGAELSRQGITDQLAVQPDGTLEPICAPAQYDAVQPAAVWFGHPVVALWPRQRYPGRHCGR